MIIDDGSVAELVRRWEPGWGRCRGLAAAVDTGVALRVPVAAANRHEEIFALHADEHPESLAELAKLVISAGPLTWLTTMTTRPHVTREVLEAAGLTVFGDPETFMTTDLIGHPHHEARPPYSVRVIETDGVWHARLSTENGTTAASGMTAVIGRDAVAHEIRTDPDHRRRGLGSVVMSALTDAAVRAGARTGLLIASPDGERLYRRLGWTPRATVLTAKAARR
ncbi:GNAT family N-acetyltransferase [Stackebrandtia soli]|uniref:GNAT family N-acetyltransferase n=1 Tax=Stackebrandtia soli TaxID=1892856 RepID=UPI0039E7867A